MPALGALGASSVVGLGYVLRSIFEPPIPGIRLTDGGGGMMGGGMMGGPRDMSRYMERFMRHHEISRVVKEIPGGVRTTTTESNSPHLAAQVQAHVSSSTPICSRASGAIA